MKHLKRCRDFAPLFCPLALAVGIGGALLGYVPPVYEVIPPMAVQEDAEEPLLTVSAEDMLAIPVSQESQNALGLADGIYEGVGIGFGGLIRVAVAVQNGRIAQAGVLENEGDDKEFLLRAQNVIRQVLTEQSTHVELISGATKSSRGILQGIRVALGQERAPVLQTSAPEPGCFDLPDGIYTGTAEGYRGPITAAVVVQDRQLRAVLIQKSEDDPSFFARAAVLLRTVVEAQSLAVDTITGATYSSRGILQAIANALDSQAAATQLTEEFLPLSLPETEEETEVEATAPLDSTPELEAPESEIGRERLERWSSWLQQRIFSKLKTKETPTQADADISEAEISSAAEPLWREESDTPTEKETAPAQRYADGVYTATAVCEPDEYLDFLPYEITVTLRLEQNRIVSLPTAVGASGDNLWYFNRALKGSGSVTGMMEQLLTKESLADIDLVSEATCSSRAILTASEAALAQAELPKEGV